tara:strand:+ start:5697 stop:6239 length:543 start_codon:yes stop_codon:yes gene_type:complete
MKYFSTSKGKKMKIKDMHMMHIENVLLKDLKIDNLSQPLQAALLKEYIFKIQETRQDLHERLKNERVANGVLVELFIIERRARKALETAQQAKPAVATSAFPNKTVIPLEFYRQVALELIKKHGRVSADQLRKDLEDSGYKVSGQALTHVFRDDRFEQVGYRRSSWAGARGRYINNWTAA